MSSQEWESFCDGCGRCCLVKIEDEDTGKWHLTRLACSLLDVGSCTCTDYSNRHARMPDCVAINPEKVRTLDWLPETCGYRVIARGGKLAWWHPLISGTRDTVHEAGISVRGAVMSENKVDDDAMHRYIIRDYPGQRVLRKIKK